MIKFEEDRQDKKLQEIRRDEEEEMAKWIASEHGLDYADLTTVPINSDALRLVDKAKSEKAFIAPFQVVGKRLRVALKAPDNKDAIQIIDDLKKSAFEVELFVASMASLQKAWKRYEDLSYSMETKAGTLDVSSEEIAEFIKTVKTVKDISDTVKSILSEKRGFRVSRVLEAIMAGALAMNASDIHLEPEESYVRLRYRLDGVLVNILEFDHESYRLILSRVKLVSGMKLNVTGAQDGRFSVSMGKGEIEIRSSILPSAYKETVVLRILNPNSISVPMDELGIEPRLYKIIEKEIGKPNGMILTTGPTGSGKTTTLYAFLKKVHAPGIKIITIENPVEYHVPGIVQTQIDPDKNYTFAEGLRSALRQDPDIIMVGEIRDGETAEIAINASLTGHLVFSTLHTNNAAGSYPRLIDLGVNSKIITSAVTVVIAQRLVRKLCPTCRKAVPLSEKQKAMVAKVAAELHHKEDLPQTDTVYEAVGCAECGNTGFRGRIGVFEAIVTDSEIEKIVRENPSEREIREVARKQDILNMTEDGIIKILRGVTSFAELERVVDVETATSNSKIVE